MGREFEFVKCGNKDYKKSELRTTGGKLSKIFDVQKKLCQLAVLIAVYKIL